MPAHPPGVPCCHLPVSPLQTLGPAAAAGCGTRGHPGWGGGPEGLPGGAGGSPRRRARAGGRRGRPPVRRGRLSRRGEPGRPRRYLALSAADGAQRPEEDGQQRHEDETAVGQRHALGGGGRAGGRGGAGPGAVVRRGLLHGGCSPRAPLPARARQGHVLLPTGTSSRVADA